MLACLSSSFTIRRYHKRGPMDAGVLLGIHSPGLNSLTLKDLHAHDLDLFWELMDTSKYTSLKSLIFCDFEPMHTFFKTFQDIITFTSLHSLAGESILVNLLLEGAPPEQAGSHVPWPKLQNLSFPFDACGDDDEVIKDIVAVRKSCGYPLSKILLGRALEEMVPGSKWATFKLNSVGKLKDGLRTAPNSITTTV